MSEISSWRELLEFRVALVLELLFGRDELIGQRDVLTRGGRELALARMFFGKARVLLLVGEHGWGRRASSRAPRRQRLSS